MGLPGVKINVTNGNLGLIPPSAEQTTIFAGNSLGGTPGTLQFFGSVPSLTSTLIGGEVVEAAAYALDTTGNIVGVYTMPRDNAGGESAVTHLGSGTGTMAVADAPASQITMTVASTGSLGSSTVTFAVGGGPAGVPVTTAATYQVPGTYTTVTLPSGTYTSGDYWVISPTGVVTYHNAGGGSDPGVGYGSHQNYVDYYRPLITITTGGALATMQFTYSLDGTLANTSAPILSTSGGKYALPGTGIYVTFSGSFTAGDTYSFQVAPPSFNNTSLQALYAALETTYLSSPYSLISVVKNIDSAADWATEAATCETGSVALANLGVYTRTFTCVPTAGTVTASGGAVVVDTADTQSVLITQRQSVSAPHVVGCPGDAELTSVISGLSFSRNAAWVVSARASLVSAATNIGAVADGAVPGVTKLYYDEAATPGLDAVGYVTLRTFAGSLSSGTGLPGFFITDGHTLDTVTSDYYPLTNARVIDRACTLARAEALPLVNSQVPTTTRNGIPGIITLVRAGQINSQITSALTTALVNNSPQDAVAASAQVDLTHNILADGNLIIGIAVQPFAYARTITVNIGLAVQA